MKASVEPNEPKKMNPTLYLDEKELPEVEEIELGSECVLEVRGKMASKSIDEYDGKKKVRGVIEILKIRVLKKNGETKDFKKFEQEYSRK